MDQRTPNTRLRLVRQVLVLGMCCAFWGAAVLAAQAQTVPHVVRVEEDWELVVGTPDADTDAPQVACLVSPAGGAESLHAELVLNHQSLPDYVPGGIQLQVWNGETPLVARKFPNGSVMSQQGETVRWTQTMQLTGGLLTFEVVGGTSSTWGSFGGQGYLKAAADTALADLDGYDPDVSVANSGVGYAANRVQSLTLKRVRRVLSNGVVYEDSTARSVHLQ